MSRSVVLAVAALASSGCATDPAVYARQSSMQLCMDVMSMPAGNVNRPARLAELQRRGETCAAYAGPASAAAAAQASRDAAATQLGSQLLQQGQPQPQQPMRQGTHTYIMNGRMVTCSTMGSVTNCF